MNYDEAKKLIDNILKNQSVPLSGHQQIQTAWELILGKAEKGGGLCPRCNTNTVSSTTESVSSSEPTEVVDPPEPT